MKQNKIKKTNPNQGITLIALIITIIVMLILVTVSITMAVKGGLFKYAGKATKETQNAITAEQMLAEGKIQIGDFFYDSYDDYLNGIYSENQPNAPIQLTYTLSNNEPTRGAVDIYITPQYKDFVDYPTWGRAILDDLEDKIKDEDELKKAKEALLLEGINYLDIEQEYWSGEGFDTLQEFVDWANKEWDTDYENIYEFMEGEYASGETDNETINMFMTGYGDMYIKPEEYYNEYAKTIITKPNGEDEEVWWSSRITYKVTKNGNYTFTAENPNKKGEKGAITVRVTNIIEEKFSNIYKETTEYKENGKTVAWIPKGFAVGVESVNTVINKVSEGLVITDKVDNEGHSIGNEFVWIPVEDGKFNRTEWEDNAPTETINANRTEEVPQNLIDSVEEYGGFYIGRYEAGYSSGRTSSNKATTAIPLSKKGVYPYNYINWTDAKARSEEMYEENEGVVSTLCYGVEWDAALRFIKDKVDVTNSTNWGNYNNHEFTFSRDYYSSSSWHTSETNTKPNGSSWLLTTGASDSNKAKNIYDLAGNVYEWTMESNSTTYRVGRGGIYAGLGSGFPASYRGYDNPTYSNDGYGFRVALYIS